MLKPLTIGVFDSGFGGLTVLRALLPLLPGARFLYLGDTARLPYGSKSRETIARYALSSCNFLLEQGADLLVIACNTATALALDHLQASLPIPVLGVIQPGAQAALAATQTVTRPATQTIPQIPTNPGAPGLDPQTWVSPSHSDLTTAPHVLVLATAATVQSHAYTQALHTLGLKTTEKACPLLVPLVEEGWLPPDLSAHTAVTQSVLRIYLSEAQAAAPHATTLLLGCTHYPLLKPLIRQTLLDLNYPLTLIDSAAATAHATHSLVQQHVPHRTLAPETTTTFFATDSIAKFQQLGSRFLGQPLPYVHLIDLGG